MNQTNVEFVNSILSIAAAMSYGELLTAIEP